MSTRDLLEPTPPPRRTAPKPNAGSAAGHRERLRARFAKAGKDGLQDYELLELILFNAIPRRDVKPLAKTLIATFGSFADTLTAPKEQLLAVEAVDAKGTKMRLNEMAVVQFSLVATSARELLRANVIDRPVLSSWDALLSYLTAETAYEQIEQFRILFLNNKNRVIADEKQQTGTVNHTPVYPREVVKRALTLNAAAIILVHNHPSGDPTPSMDDVKMTTKIIDAARAVDIAVHDHVIIGRGQHFSFRSSGLMEPTA